MTALAASPAAAPALIRELFDRHSLLAGFGTTLMILAAATLAAQAIDTRELQGASVWAKPAKFFLSLGVFTLTFAWFFGYVRPERRRSRLMRATVALLVIAAGFELAWITLQAARGLESHWNFDTAFHALMYALMGVFAVALAATTLPLAWEIGRRPARGLRPDFVAGVVAGLILTFLLGAGFGGYMSAQAGHSVGPEGGRLPVFGWNRSGGDLRVAHFLGIHAQQAIPLLAAAIAPFGTRLRWLLLAGGTFLYVALTVAMFALAVSGRPLLPL